MSTRRIKRSLYTLNRLSEMNEKIVNDIIKFYNIDRPLHFILRVCNKHLLSIKEKEMDMFDIYMVLVQLRQARKIKRNRETHSNEMTLEQFAVLVKAWTAGKDKEDCVEECLESNTNFGSKTQAREIVKCMNLAVRDFRGSNGKIIKSKAAQSFIKFSSFFQIWCPDKSKPEEIKLYVDIRSVPEPLLKDVADSCEPLRLMIEEVLRIRKIKQIKIKERDENDEAMEIIRDSIHIEENVKEDLSKKIDIDGGEKKSTPTIDFDFEFKMEDSDEVVINDDIEEDNEEDDEVDYDDDVTDVDRDKEERIKKISEQQGIGIAERMRMLEG